MEIKLQLERVKPLKTNNEYFLTRLNDFFHETSLGEIKTTTKLLQKTNTDYNFPTKDFTLNSGKYSSVKNKTATAYKRGELKLS